MLYCGGVRTSVMRARRVAKLVAGASANAAGFTHVAVG